MCALTQETLKRPLRQELSPQLLPPRADVLQGPVSCVTARNDSSPTCFFAESTLAGASVRKDTSLLEHTKTQLVQQPLFALRICVYTTSQLFTTARTPCTALMRSNALLKTLLTTTTMCAALDLYTSIESLVAKPYYKLEQSVASKQIPALSTAEAPLKKLADGPGAAFECRLDRTSREGPLRVPCEVVARMGGAYDNGTAPFYYDIIANPMEAGTYDLRLLWMHSTHKEAFSPTSKPLCRVLRAGGDERL